MGSESGSETEYGSVSVNKLEETHFSSYLKDVAPVSALKHDVRFVQVPAPQNNVHVIWSTRQQRTWVKNNPLYLQEKNRESQNEANEYMSDVLFEFLIWFLIFDQVLQIILNLERRM